MKNIAYIIILFFTFLSCETKNTIAEVEKWKQEILESEQNFAKMAQEVGIHNAFVAFAADDAVIMRNNTLVKGKNSIDNYYKNSKSKTLTWSPDFIDVSSSGDFGYTYGIYHYTYKDSLEQDQVDTGIFHTVWKHQPDSSWKFVWD